MRDPRLEDGTLKYDVPLGISARPEGLVYWRFRAEKVGRLMDEDRIIVQHVISDTKWFLPS